MNVDIKDSYSICNLPMGDYDFESTAENGCAGVLIVNSNGTFNFTAPSGSIVDLPDTPVNVRNVSGDEVGSGEVPSVTGGVITVPDCPVSGDGTVNNSDNSFSQLIPAGDTYTLDDYDFEFQDPDGIVISNEIRPAMIGETFIIGSAGICPTEFTYGLFVNGVSYGNITVDVFQDINITT